VTCRDPNRYNTLAYTETNLVLSTVGAFTDTTQPFEIPLGITELVHTTTTLAAV